MTDFWNGKRVLVTGHTGFKGVWLSLWLKSLGAEVYGYALAADGDPSLFLQVGLERQVDHKLGDVGDAEALQARIGQVQPDVILHLAAQSLVRRSYREPAATWAVNVQGSVNLLDALRGLHRRCAVVMVTTDKVYKNLEWEHAYRESDRLGGHDPYSASKAAMEIAVDSFRLAFFHGSSVRIASARAGNVIGGGDWAEDRIIPDLVRALSSGTPVKVRNPRASRPWQHVLEPLSGYLSLAQSLYERDDDTLCSAFNFGPASGGNKSVSDLVDSALTRWPGVREDAFDAAQPHEARLLSLTIDRACAVLGWTPRLSFEETVTATIDWYRAVHSGRPALDVTLNQISAYGAP